eukprot:10791084-Prorocentrum_lima.AAC.1
MEAIARSQSSTESHRNALPEDPVELREAVNQWDMAQQALVFKALLAVQRRTDVNFAPDRRANLPA